MMSEYDALLRAIAANPDEDTPRLMLADWLEEHGDANQRDQAEYIRLEIRLAQGRPWDAGNEDYERLAARRDALMNGLAEDGTLNCHHWMQEARGQDHDVTPSRGMPTRIVLTVEQFLDEYAALRDLYPLTDVTIDDLDMENAVLLAECPALSRVQTLRLQEPYTFMHENAVPQNSAALSILLKSPHLPKLKKLDCRFFPINDARMVAIGECAALSELESLELDVSALPTELADDAPSPLAPITHLRNLTHLVLHSIAQSELGLERLPEEFRHRLRHLDLRDKLILTVRDSDVLATQFPNLEALEIWNSACDTDATWQLVHPAIAASCAGLKNLKELTLHGCELPASTLNVLATTMIQGDNSGIPNLNTFPSLRYLDLSQNRLVHSAAAMQAFCDTRCSHLLALHTLKLNGCQLPADAIDALANSSTFCQLHRLELNGNAVQDSGAAVLARSTAFPALDTLGLNACFIDEEGIRALVGSSNLSRLSLLDLTSNGYSRSKPYFQNVVQVGMGCVAVTRELFTGEQEAQLTEKLGAQLCFTGQRFT